MDSAFNSSFFSLAARRVVLPVVALVFSLIITACGGSSSGGNSGPGPGTGGGGSGSGELTVDLGPDLDIDEGETVTFQAETSGADGDIVGRSLSSPSSALKMPLKVLSFGAMRYSFTGPDTETEDEVQYGIVVTVKDEGGNEASDTLLVTVHRVNTAPTVDAGADFSARGTTEVTFAPEAKDSDGEVAQYQWTQTAGASVELVGADQAQAAFEAPSTNEVLELTFSLTVTDDEGATSDDSVTVTVTPEDAPDLALHFPPKETLYSLGTVPAFGTVSVIEGASLESVVVVTGVGEYEAVVEEDGQWRVDEAVLPEGLETTELTVKATDSEGRVTAITANFSSDDERNLGSGPAFGEPLSLCLDDEEKKLWVLADSTFTTSVQLVPVSIDTGTRGDSVTDFADDAQGENQMALTAMACDFDNGFFYLASSPADENLESIIYRVSMTDGSRELVSGRGRGSGDPLQIPTDIILGESGELVVADNGANAFVSIDLTTGDRSEIASQVNDGSRFEYPLLLTKDVEADRLLFIKNTTPDSDIFSMQQTDGFVSSELVSAAVFGAGSESLQIGVGALSMSINADGSLLYVLPDSAFNPRFVTVNVANGEREGQSIELGFEDVIDTQPKFLAYQGSKNLLYFGVAMEGSTTIYAMDPETGTAAPVSHASRWQ
ncbi:PKD domain-containing protein [Marinimicrobium locisalis]|uniref:PKD domain-containing protein n=1 Tax=Marinimicrobium locisalis TaxID=546022 RepID=UPI0032219B2E